MSRRRLFGEMKNLVQTSRSKYGENEKTWQRRMGKAMPAIAHRVKRCVPRKW